MPLSKKHLRFFSISLYYKYYKFNFSGQLQQIRRVKLAKIICQNLGVDPIQRDVFHVPSPRQVDHQLIFIINRIIYYTMSVYVNNSYTKYNDSIYNQKLKSNLHSDFYFNNDNSSNYYPGNCVHVLSHVSLGSYLTHDKLYQSVQHIIHHLFSLISEIDGNVVADCLV